MGPSSSSSSSRDAAIKSDLDKDNKWETTLWGKFLAHPHSIYKFINADRSSHAERLAFYGKLVRFIQRCKKCPDAMAAAAPCVDERRSRRHGTPKEEDSGGTLEEVSQTASVFKGVRSPDDLEILEYCAFKFLGHTNELNRTTPIRYQ